MNIEQVYLQIMKNYNKMFNSYNSIPLQPTESLSNIKFSYMFFYIVMQTLSTTRDIVTSFLFISYSEALICICWMTE